MRIIEGILERTIHAVGRFAVGFGTVLALVCAVVIVTTGPRLGGAEPARPADVVRLDPVIVTISASGFRAAQAGAPDAPDAPAIVRVPDHGATEG